MEMRLVILCYPDDSAPVGSKSPFLPRRLCADHELKGCMPVFRRLLGLLSSCRRSSPGPAHLGSDGLRAGFDGAECASVVELASINLRELFRSGRAGGFAESTCADPSFHDDARLLAMLGLGSDCQLTRLQYWDCQERVRALPLRAARVDSVDFVGAGPLQALCCLGPVRSSLLRHSFWSWTARLGQEQAGCQAAVAAVAAAAACHQQLAQQSRLVWCASRRRHLDGTTYVVAVEKHLLLEASLEALEVRHLQPQLPAFTTCCNPESKT